MNKTFFYILFFIVAIGLLFPSYSYNKGDAYYDSIYKASVALTQDNQIKESILLLKEITSKNRLFINKRNINSHYDLGQIYLSSLSDYELAIFHFDFIVNKIPFKEYKIKEMSNGLRDINELRKKSLFMLGYINHNHIGNLTESKKYYLLFLNQYSDTDLTSSVEYELELIEKSISNFDKINN